MWVARFKLKDDKDIYSPLCEKYKIDFFAYPYTCFVKNNKINVIAGGVISGSVENKELFIQKIKKDKRIKSIERHHDFILVHAQHPVSRKAKTELLIFYNPQYIKVKPIRVSRDGWEYWEIACLDRNELNKIINASVKHYSGELISIQKEKLRSIANLEFRPNLSQKQMEALEIAYKQGYYNYPRKLTIPEMSKKIKRAYSTFQENLRKGENKIIDYFLKYR